MAWLACLYSSHTCLVWYSQTLEQWWMRRWTFSLWQRRPWMISMSCQLLARQSALYCSIIITTTTIIIIIITLPATVAVYHPSADYDSHLLAIVSWTLTIILQCFRGLFPVSRNGTLAVGIACVTFCRVKRVCVNGTWVDIVPITHVQLEHWLTQRSTVYADMFNISVIFRSCTLINAENSEQMPAWHG